MMNHTSTNSSQVADIVDQEACRVTACSTSTNNIAAANDIHANNQTNTQPQAADPFQLQVEKLLALLGAQSRGETCNDEIEQTLSAIVPTSTTRATSLAAVSKPKDDKHITEGQQQQQQQQQQQHPREEDKATNGNDEIHTNNGSCGAENRGPTTKVTIESLLQQEEEEANWNDDNKRKKYNFYLPETWNTLDDIPFGRAGAKMMVTFGDGHNPKPDAVAAVLMVC
jgi:hypothetical protein